MAPEHTDIELLRHGEPEGGHKFRGSVDDPLSETGWQQMREAVAEREDWDHIASSPLLRCADFAKELSATRNIPLNIDNRLREMHFGRWEGRETQKLMKEAVDELIPFWRDPVANPPPEGETLQSLASRLSESWNKLVQTHRGKRLLIVCHGGVIRMLLAQALSMPMTHFSRFDVPYASISRIRIWHAPGLDYPVLLSHSN